MKRSFKHWTFEYLWSRLQDKLHRRLHPDEPWLTPAVVQTLDNHLTKQMSGLEFGSGRSTVWFARRLGRLTSVEHSVNWFVKVNNLLKKSGIQNVSMILRDNSPDNSLFLTQSINSEMKALILSWWMELTGQSVHYSACQN